ncbi:MAG: hypothetical protein ABI168_02435 [Ginsengibacter sp.]
MPKSYHVHNKAITGASTVPGRTTHTLANNQQSNHAWETFPRSLTAKQCANPFSAISQCCAFMPEAEWRNLLNDITECALSNTTLYEMQPECNILRVRRYLLRLLEGCHLIGLRSEEKTATNTKCVM